MEGMLTCYKILQEFHLLFILNLKERNFASFSSQLLFFLSIYLFLLDMLALFYVVEKIPKSAMKIAEIFRIFKTLIFEGEEEKAKTNYYLKFRLPALLFVWRMIFKFSSAEVIEYFNSISKDYSFKNPV